MSASNPTITSADSVFTITVAGLFPAPVQLQGYSAEKAWSTDQQELAETLVGVDGLMSAGYVPAKVTQSISLQADSASIAIFEAIATATQQQKDVFFISCSIDLPSVGKSYIGTRGVLKNWKPIPDGAKVLQPQEFSIDWQSLVPTLS